MRYTPMERAQAVKPMVNLTHKLFSLLLVTSLIGGLASCGPSAPSTESTPAAAETTAGTEATSGSAPKPAKPTAVAESAPPASAAPDPAANGTTAEAPRPSPVSLDKKDCGQMATQIDMNQCAADNFTISDQALNQSYQQVLQGLDQGAKAQLTTAEERWLVFRDAQCNFASSRYEGGSIAPLIQASCMEQVTDNRVAELQQTDGSDLSYANADAQLNEVYQAVQALADDGAGDDLTDVQLSWLDYRDAHCEYEANILANADVKACLATMTETRLWQLQELMDDWSL